MQTIINILAFILSGGFSLYMTFCAACVLFVVCMLNVKNTSDRIGAVLMVLATIVSWYLTYCAFLLI